jgi:hypothetical protein
MSYLDEITFMTVDPASRRLAQIADDLNARLTAAEATIAKCCGAGLTAAPAPSAAAPSSTSPRPVKTPTP